MTKKEFEAKVMACGNKAFGRMILKVWNSLPAIDQAHIWNYWEDPKELVDGKLSFKYWAFSQRFLKKQKCNILMAQTNGFYFIYNANIFDKVDRAVQEACIAHEFAHAFRKARYFERPEAQFNDAEERAADRLATRWGYAANQIQPALTIWTVRFNPKTKRLIEQKVKAALRGRMAGLKSALQKALNGFSTAMLAKGA